MVCCLDGGRTSSSMGIVCSGEEGVGSSSVLEHKLIRVFVV
jgi:hypothetical protein